MMNVNNPMGAELVKSPELSPFQTAMLKHVKALIEMSRAKMGNYYVQWDLQDMVYRGIRNPDMNDRKAMERAEPGKMVVPLTYAQVQTFVAFCMSMYFQRERLYELIGMGEEDFRAAKVGEALLERDLQYNIIDARLNQFLTDIAKYGLGVLKTGWVRETQMVREVTQTQPTKFLGMSFGGGSQEQIVEKTKFLGNRIFNVSPYRFFPDTRLPVARFQEGEFCGSEDEYSITTLRQMQKDGQIFGVEHIKVMNQESIDNRNSRISNLSQQVHDSSTSRSQSHMGTVIVTEVQVAIIPSTFMVDGKPLGEEDYPVKYNVWYANDNKLIKCEPLGYLHNKFTYDVGEFAPDIHNVVNMGLAELIDHLQNVVTWFINSHIASVRKTIDNRLIVDPSGVEMKDLVERRPMIRLSPNAYRGGVDKYIKQLDVTDVTARHTEDAQIIQNLMQVVTGINDNALGQFHQGRRSATEARTVNSATASRLKMTASLIFKTAIQPMGEKMLSNLRDGLDEETYVRVVGDTADPSLLSQFTKVSRDQLVGNYDFTIFDGTMPSERGAQAENIQELIQMLMQAPQLLQILGYDITALIKEVLELRGVKSPDRFKTPQTIVAQQQPIPGIPGQPQSGQPQQQPPQGAPV